MSQIPEKFWKAIIEFLSNKKTGKITLNVKDGQILKVEFGEILSL